MTRNVSVDILKGVGIFAVVLGHYIIPSGLSDFIFSFHMPLFFILSGYFFKLKDNAHVLRQGWSKLIIPYLFVGVISIFLSGVKALLHGDGLSGFVWGVEATLWGSGSNSSSALFADFPVIGAVWFLLAMFVCKATYNCLYGLCGSKAQYFAIALSLVAVAVCQYVFSPFSILPGLSAMLFYWVGIMFRQYEDRVPSGMVWLIAYCAVWVAVAQNCQMSMVRCFYSCLPLNFIGAVCAFAVLYYVAAPAIQRIKQLSDAFVYMGRYSLIILCFHLLELNYCPYGKLFDIVPEPFAWSVVFVIKLIVIFVLVETARRIPLTRKVFSLN